MYELQARQKLKKRIFSRPVFAILLILSVFTFKAAWNMYARWIESSKNLADVTASVEALRARESELLVQIERLETSRGIEEEIRKKYSVVKPGEELVVVVDAPEAPVDNDAERLGFWKRSWNRVKDWFGRGEDEDGTSENEI